MRYVALLRGINVGGRNMISKDELRQLFEEWISEIEQEILDDVGSDKPVDVESIMTKFNLSKESVVYLIARLAKSDQVVLDIKKRSQ